MSDFLYKNFVSLTLQACRKAVMAIIRNDHLFVIASNFFVFASEAKQSRIVLFHQIIDHFGLLSKHRDDGKKLLRKSRDDDKGDIARVSSPRHCKGSPRLVIARHPQDTEEISPFATGSVTKQFQRLILSLFDKNVHNCA